MPSNLVIRVRYWSLYLQTLPTRIYLQTLPTRIYLHTLMAWLHLGIRYRLAKAALLQWRADRLRARALVIEGELFLEEADLDE